uniref:Uncharacterized protein n=1 Tax=Strigamia maritima TaxID=126957 RepID=T1IQE6_STRMM
MKSISKKKSRKIITKNMPNSHKLHQTVITNRTKGKKKSLHIFAHKFKPKIDKRKKLLWILAFVISAFICLHQLTDRVTNYFDYPIVTDVHIQRVKTARFPPIILCKNNFVDIFFEKIEEKIAKQCSILEQCNNTELKSYNFSVFGLNILDIWYKNSIQQSRVKSTMSCAGLYDKSICTDANKYLNISTLSLNTYYGRCFIYLSHDILEFQEARTYWSFKVKHHDKDDTLYDANSGKADIKFYIQRKEEKYSKSKIYYFARNLMKKQMSNIYISSKTYEYLNSTKHQCFNTTTVTTCKNRCFQKKLQEMRTTNCGLPFMNPKMPICQNYNDAAEAYSAVQDTYLAIKYDECNCGRMCIETKHVDLMDALPLDEKKDETKFMFFLQTD